MFTYTVVLEDWDFGELSGTADYKEFDNPEDAFVLHDEIYEVMESEGYYLFDGGFYNLIDVKVIRKK